MSSPETEVLLSRIRAEILRYGQSIVACDELLCLVSKYDSILAQFGHIFVTAEKERWSFEFRTDGTVRFADLDFTSAPIGEWNRPQPKFVKAAQA
jgi:hypothetical protein